MEKISYAQFIQEVSEFVWERFPWARHKKYDIDGDYFDAAIMLHELVAGTLSYYKNGSQPDDPSCRIASIKNYISTLESCEDCVLSEEERLQEELLVAVLTGLVTVGRGQIFS